MESNLTQDCTQILDALLKLELAPEEIERLKNILRKALNCHDNDLTESALELAEKLDLDAELRDEIQKAYDWWVKEGPQGPKGSGVVVPNAAGKLLKHLSKDDRLSFDYLRNAITDAKENRISEVRSVAVEGLVNLMVRDNALVPPVLEEIKAGTFSPALLDKLSTTAPTLCALFLDEIVDLLNSDQIDVKLSCIRSLGDGWCNFEKAELLLRPLLGADEPYIRDEVVKVLRRRL